MGRNTSRAIPTPISLYATTPTSTATRPSCKRSTPSSPCARRGSAGSLLSSFTSFNTMFAEGLYREVQVVNNFHAPAVPVLFTWPSRGKLSAYLYDLNSATSARDELEHTLRLLLASNAEEVNVLAHSMGNWVTVEALRGIRIWASSITRKISSVISFWPRPTSTSTYSNRSCAASANSRGPFYVVLSEDDKALWLSGKIAGGVARVGDDPRTAQFAELGATVIDLTEVEGNDATDHDKFDQLAAVAPELRATLARGIKWIRAPARPQRNSRRWRPRRRHRLAAHAARRPSQDHRQSIAPVRARANCVISNSATYRRIRLAGIGRGFRRRRR